MFKRFILTVALICSICLGVIAATALRSPAIVSAADGSTTSDSATHTHPVCGASHNDIGDHTSDTCENITYTAWDKQWNEDGVSSSIYNSDNNAYIYLTEDADTNYKIEIPSGKTLYLCLNGHKITKVTQNDNYQDRMSVTYIRGNLVLCDCKGGGKLTHSEGKIGQGAYIGGGTFTMYGGEISGNYAGNSSTSISGAGVGVASYATFKMYGGKITDNHCTVAQNHYGGGGVHVQGTFTMYGGEISNNSSVENGGGVSAEYKKDNTINLFGGKIINNTASVNGGGLYLSNRNLNISDNVEISGNTADNDGGGIYFYGKYSSYTATSYSLTISGSAKITQNTASVNGGGIYVESGPASGSYDYGIGNLKINGGSVTNNTVTADNGDGGGIYFNGGTFNVSGDVTAYGNTKNSKANDAYLKSGSYITLDGELAGNGKIGVMTEAPPTTSGYAKIAKISSGNKDSFSSDKFVYENTSKAELSTAISYKTLYLVACVHKFGTELASDENSHWHGCSLCDKQEDTEAHTVVADAAVEATCTTAGKTAGSHCSVCKRILVAQTDTPALDHDWNDGVVTTDPDCVNDGVKTFTCKRDGCGATKTEAVEALGHTYSSDWSSNDTEHYHKCIRCDDKNNVAAHSGGTATCTEQAKCEVCSRSYGNALGHNHSEEWTVDVPATCTIDGSKSHHCSRCDDKADVTVISKLGHDTVSHAAKAATCTAFGWDAYETCTRCDYTTYNQKDALGHNHSEDWTIDVPATCTTDGSKSHHCSRCDDKADVTVISKLGHDTVSHAAKAATCTAFGWDAYETCTRCDYTTYNQKDALGHNHSEDWTIDVPATCTTDGSKSHHCSRCDDKADVTVIPATGHTEAIDNAIPATCTEAGKTAGKHCSVCNEVLVAQTTVPATGHTEEIDNAVPATCTEAGKTAGKHCSVCNEVLVAQTTVPATGHTEEIDNAVPATCTEAGKTAGKHCSVCNEVLVAQTTIPALGHVYDDDYDATCNVCGHERTDVKVAPKILEGHDGKWNTTDSGELTFTTNVTSSKFVGITVDGVRIDETKFEKQNDGTKIVLKQEFLQSLSAGKHTISIISEDGTAETHFTIEARSATETKVGKAWWLLLIPAVAMLIVLGSIVIKNKKSEREE